MVRSLGARKSMASFVVLAALVVWPSSAGIVADRAGLGAALPARLSDAAFWTLVSDISEPGGYFRITDNYTSNEREVGQVFTMLREAGVQGGVYMGVGPEQNFSYISSVRPAMAFIVDIRRQAVMQHLMFKAIFELAADRVDFIALLFSKPRPAGLARDASIEDIWNAFVSTSPEPDTVAKNETRIVSHLTEKHGFKLDAEEITSLKSVLAAFVGYGPAISTRGSGNFGNFGFGGGRGGFGSGGTFAELTGWAFDASGKPQSFLSSDEHYMTVKTLHEKNLIVPVSGDFGGPKAIRAIGAYLKEQGGVVSAFYVSNVEQYLFQDAKAQAFYDNVSTLPLSDRTVFIRPYALRQGYGAAATLCGIKGFIDTFTGGRIASNNTALACAR